MFSGGGQNDDTVGWALPCMQLTCVCSLVPMWFPEFQQE